MSEGQREDRKRETEIERESERAREGERERDRERERERAMFNHPSSVILAYSSFSMRMINIRSSLPARPEQHVRVGMFARGR